MQSPFNKKRRFNPEHTWAIFCSVFILAVMALLVYFSWYFIGVTERLDAPGTPTLEINADKIMTMEQTLDMVEGVVQSRTGESSQNTLPVVQ